MNAKLISDALGRLDEAYVEEALNYRAQNRTLLPWGAAAACFAVFCTVAWAALSFPGEPAGPAAADPPPDVTTAPPTPTQPEDSVSPSAPDAPQVVRIARGDIVVNEDIEPPVRAARIYYDPALYEEVFWDRDAVIDYYGRSFLPSYVPDGLTAFNPEESTRVEIRKEDGAVAWDALYLSYFRVYGAWEDGSPRTIDENCVQKGFTVGISRIGLISDCIHLDPEDSETKLSHIAGVPVAIGYRSCSYGPYDPETHEPSGYYDFYVAEFELDGVKLQILSYQMEPEELVKLTASIICPEQEIVLEE